MSDPLLHLVVVRAPGTSPLVETTAEANVVAVDPQRLTSPAFDLLPGEVRQTLDKADIVLTAFAPGSPGTLTRLGRLLEGLPAPLLSVGERSAGYEIEALLRGADRYVERPVKIDRLLAIHAAHTRRLRAPRYRAGSMTPAWATTDRLSLGRLSLDWPARRAMVDERPLNLCTSQLELLGFLAQTPGVVCSKTDLLDAVWGVHKNPKPNTVEVTVNHLRNALHRSSIIDSIGTVWGKGYRLDAAPFGRAELEKA